jgi:hypothetical protein
MENLIASFLIGKLINQVVNCTKPVLLNANRGPFGQRTSPPRLLGFEPRRKHLALAWILANLFPLPKSALSAIPNKFLLKKGQTQSKTYILLLWGRPLKSG